jgi:hypothetical protein
MFKSILVPIDLSDTDLAKPAIATAATLSQTWSGMVRLLNVLPMTPVMLAEYVPADFDTQQRQTLRGGARYRGPGIRDRCGAHLRRGAAGRNLSRDSGRSRGDPCRPDRDDIAPAGDADLFPRLQCRPCGALCQMLGAGGPALTHNYPCPGRGAAYAASPSHIFVALNATPTANGLSVTRPFPLRGAFLRRRSQ